MSWFLRQPVKAFLEGRGALSRQIGSDVWHLPANVFMSLRLIDCRQIRNK